MGTQGRIFGLLAILIAVSLPIFSRAAQLVGVGGGQCINVPEHGGKVIVVACNGSPSQKWNVVNGQIIGIGGKCVDVAGAVTAQPAPLIIQSCGPPPSQRWTVQ